MRKHICKFLLKLFGWKAGDPPCPGNKAIILGVPHTSAWDFMISFFYYYGVGGKASVMVKKEFFWGPLAPIMRWMGGVPVDRAKGATVAKQVIDAMNKAEYMHLAIAPEGTRKRTDNWKTKTIGRGEPIELTDDAKADMKRIRQHYKDKGYGAKYPELYSTGKDLE